MSHVAVVMGANGNFGGHMARALAAAGWEVRRHARGTDLVAAARGADLLVNALNPPMYHNWARLIPEITERVVAAAHATGATVLVPGNVYSYGVEPGPWGPATPHRPVSRKGAIRASMEARYREASERGARVIVLRGGDFVDASSSTTFLNMVVLKDLAKGTLTLPGAPDVPRAYANLADMARVGAALAARRDELPAYADLPYAGLCFTADELRVALERAICRSLRVASFPWWAMTLASPFWELARELREMRYLFDTPHRLDPGPLAALALDVGPEATLDDIAAAHLHARGMLTVAREA